ncbi:MAG: hypothetical protein RQ936_09480 [Gammaproteobacteria bacterium]|nr:hypothetical protein [Gammaproteobacteria bacterium]
MQQQVGLYFTSDGIAVAAIDGSGEAPPTLKLCAFIAASEPGEQLQQLKRYVKQNNLKNRPCVAVLEDSQYSLFQIPAPPVKDDELKSALHWSIKDLVDYPTDAAVIDAFRVPTQERREEKMYVVVTPRDEIQKTVDFVRKTGLRLDTIDIEELSLGNLIEQVESLTRGVAVMHFGQNHGAISLYSDSALYLTRKIDTGLFRFETMPSPDAEEQIYESIILELQRSLDFYESEFSRPPISKLIIAPRHPILQGFSDYVSNHSDLTVEIMKLGQIYTDSTALDDENQARCLLAIAAASRKIRATE